MHLLVRPLCFHRPGAWCLCLCLSLPVCKRAVPRCLVIFWKSSRKVFSGEAKEIYRCKIRILIIVRNVISNFCFSKRNINFKFHSSSLKILFLKEDLRVFLLVRQALPRALGTFREKTSTEMAQLLSYGPKLLGVMITKGARQPGSSNFHLFLSVCCTFKDCSPFQD